MIELTVVIYFQNHFMKKRVQTASFFMKINLIGTG